MNLKTAYLVAGLSALTVAAPVESQETLEVRLGTGQDQFVSQDEESFVRYTGENFSLFGNISSFKEPEVQETEIRGFGGSYSFENFGKVSLAVKQSETDDYWNPVEAESQAFLGYERGPLKVYGAVGNGSFADLSYDIGKLGINFLFTDKIQKLDIRTPEHSLDPMPRMRFFEIMDSRGDTPLQWDTPVSVMGAGMSFNGEKHSASLGYRSGDQFTYSGNEINHQGASFSYSFNGTKFKTETEADLDLVGPKLKDIRIAHSSEYDGRGFQANIQGYLKGEYVRFTELSSMYNKVGTALRLRVGPEVFRAGPFAIFERDRELHNDVLQYGLSARLGSSEFLAGLTNKKVGRTRFQEDATGYFVGANLPLSDSISVTAHLGTEGNTTNVKGGAYGRVAFSYTR